MLYYSKMGLGVATRTTFILLTLFLVSACGELETLFPSNGSYQVRTLVNGVPIEDCSIIRAGDKVRPYFAVSVADDPDLIGLLVYFQDPQGKISGGKVRYTINPDAEEITQAETMAQEETKSTEDEAVTASEAEADDETNLATTVETNVEAPVVENQKKEIEIEVKSLAQELPYFPLSASLAIGSYTLVFEALGNKETLSRTEYDVFYLDNAEFNLKDIAMYLPGLSESQLISPGTTLLLETRLDYDTRLDPYVVWYNGRNIISEGKISAGAGSILWVAPELAGFYSLRLEVFPIQLKHTVAGVSRGITLPVSPKAVDMGYYFKTVIISNDPDSGVARLSAPSLPPELLQWYQFNGDLHSSMPLSDDEQSLLPLNDKKSPRWAGAGQSYGLSTGSDDVYQLLPFNFFKDSDRGGGVFLSHVRLPAEGVILSAFFPLLTSSSEGAWVEMISEGNVIALIINAGDAAVEIPLYLDLPELQGFVPIVTEFYILPNRLDAKITLGDGLKSNAGSISLPVALSGEGRIRMGGQEKFKRENRLSAPIPAATETATPAETEDESADILEMDEAIWVWMENRETNTIWDEFAILISTAPLFPENFVEKAPVEAVSGKETAIIIYVPVESMVLKEGEAEIGGDEILSSPVADTDMEDPIKEPEMLSILSEES